MAKDLEKIKLDAETDPYSWVCPCGNYVGQPGFYPCLEDGTEVEPTIDGPWEGVLYLCPECGRVIDQYTREIIKQVPVIRDA